MLRTDAILMGMTPVYEWYQRGLALLRGGDPHAAATVLERAAAAEPDKGSIREALGRAYFDAGLIGEALTQFTRLLDHNPVNDYAHFAAGLCLGRLGRLDEACGHLRMANVMRPDNIDYGSALARHEARRSLRDRLRERETG